MAIHHYTTIETLALIIKSKSIRFNRTDKVDDSDECKGAYPNYEKYAFISCWTKDDKESIALWKMYASIDKGVRISFDDENIFKLHDCRYSDLTEMNSHIPELTQICNETISRIKGIPENDIFYTPSLHPSKIRNKDYDASQLLFERIPFCDVTYIMDDKQEFLRKNITIYENGDIGWDSGIIGTVKSDYWEFQKESRFIIRTHPIGDMSKGKNLERVENQEDLETEYIDAELSEQYLNSMTITIAPLANRASEEIIRFILDKYPGVNIKDSELKGKINK